MKNMKKWMAGACGIMLAGGIFASAPQAQAAADLYYTYPAASYGGASCLPQIESTTAWLRNGWGYNSSLNTLNVVCPIVRRNPDSSKGTSFVALWVNHSNSNLTTSCTLMHHDVNGSLVRSSAKTTTGTGVRPLYFDVLQPASTWGGYSIACTVPAHGFITGYYVSEEYR